jgi:hypothetical protein
VLLEAFTELDPDEHEGLILLVWDDENSAGEWVQLGSDDPPVWFDYGNSGVFTNAWDQTHDHFSEFIFESIAACYASDSGPGGKRPYRRGAWLREGLTAYRFLLPGGTILVTTEDARLKDGHSAWWLHSSNTAGLEKLARLVWHLGTLSETLQSSRKAGAALLQRLRSGKQET